MFHFLRRKKIVVDCFTDHSGVYETVPILHAMKLLPSWYKNLETIKCPVTFEDNNKVSIERNMKLCWGFNELFKTGVIIRNWCDTHYKVMPDSYRYYVSDGKVPEEHGASQYNNAFFGFHHTKLLCPWRLKEKYGVKFMLMGCEWHQENLNYKTLSGVLEFKLNHATNINLLLPKKEATFIIKVGKPMVHIIPLTEDRVEFKNHLVTTAELNKLQPLIVTDGNHYTLEKLSKEG